jgi:hypothetical protein
VNAANLKRAAEVLRNYATMIENSEVHHSGPLKGRCSPGIEDEVAEYRALALALERLDGHAIRCQAFGEAAGLLEESARQYQRQDALGDLVRGILTDSAESIRRLKEVRTSAVGGFVMLAPRSSRSSRSACRA